MKSENLNKLYDKIYQDESTKEPRRFIQVIESEISLFDIDEYANYSDYFKMTRLMADYGIMLVKAGYIKKSLSHLENAILRIETDKELKDKDLWNEPLYESLLFNRGYVNMKLQNRSKAKKDFKNLTIKFPENDLYENWLKSCYDYNYGILEWTFAGLAMISIFFSFLFGRENVIINRIAFYGIIVGIIGGLTTNWIRKKKIED